MTDPVDVSVSIKNAYIPNRGVVDVIIDDERISRFSRPGENITAKESHNLDGWLLLPAMAEPHAHLDKALTADIVPNPSGELMGAITAWIEAAEKGTFTQENTVQRASKAMELLITRGITAVRTHVNVIADIGISSVQALAEAKEIYADVLDVQVVALMNSPMTGQRVKVTLKLLQLHWNMGLIS